MKHDISNNISRVSATGEGLVRGVKNKVATFTVDSKGIHGGGDLAVHAEGGANMIVYLNIIIKTVDAVYISAF